MMEEDDVNLFRCPHCGRLIPPGMLAAHLGRAGGSAGRGKAKARPHDVAVRAGRLGAAKRWGKPKTA